MLSADQTVKSLLLAMLVVMAPGCSVIQHQRDDDEDRYRASVPGMDMSAAGSADTYMKVRQARAQNGVVLQVAGDDTPVRLLPLPGEGKSVFVSTLLEQTGVLEEFGSLDVTLYRSSVDTIDGIPMAVKMTSNGQRVRPESDYALQAGDRLRVSKREYNPLESLLGIPTGRR